MTGADCLKTLPPRSRTKWLCVATKAKAMERGVRKRVAVELELLAPRAARALELCLAEIARVDAERVRYGQRQLDDARCVSSHGLERRRRTGKTRSLGPSMAQSRTSSPIDERPSRLDVAVADAALAVGDERRRRPRRVTAPKPIDIDDLARASRAAASIERPSAPPHRRHRCSTGALRSVSRGVVGDADELALGAGSVDLVDDRRPDQPLRRVVGRASARRGCPCTVRTVLADGRPVAAEQDHRRRAVAGDVGAGGVDHVGEVPARAGTPRSASCRTRAS